MRISYRIVFHLAAQGRVRPDETHPEAVTQAGMSEALQARTGALSNALKRLVDAQVVAVRLAHVRGKPKRLKVYQLTTSGEELVRELRRRFRR